MRITIIGGTGHVGSFLLPRLVNAGHHVVSVSRNQRQPYILHPAWNEVQQVSLNRGNSDQEADFVNQIISTRPDIVIDMICFNRDTAEEMVKGLQGMIKQYLFCGTIWVYGRSMMVPAGENSIRKPLTEYGRDKAEAEAFLLHEAKHQGFPVTILHPGHIVGPGWKPVNPAGNLNLEVFKQLKKGEPILLPNLGMETLHHVHADDVAQAFELSIHYAEKSIGESFNIVSAQAMSMYGYTEMMGEWFGKPAEIQLLPWEKWQHTASEEDAVITWDHLIHSPCCSIEKAKRILQYKPRYSSIAAIQESVEWQMSYNKI